MITQRDVFLDAADFLGDDHAQKMHQAWLDRKLDAFLKQAASVAGQDPWFAVLEQAVGLEIFLKRHGESAGPIEQLFDHVGHDDNRRLDALMLRGRQKWHLFEYDPAINALEEVRQLADGRSDLRLAQSLNYLARLAIDTDRQLGQPVSEFFRAAREAAARVPNRSDLELLIERSELIYLRHSRQFRRYGEKVADLQKREKFFLGEGYQGIYDSIRVEEAIALRSLGTEAGRCKAAELYDAMIHGGRDDSHPGMCCYLKADLYLDRAWNAILESLKVEDYLSQASRWVDSALERLDAQRHKMAYEKADTRRSFLRTRSLIGVRDADVVVRDYAVREQLIKMLMLVGLPSGFMSNESAVRVEPSVVARLIREIIGNRIVRAAAGGGNAEKERLLAPTPALDDYLNETCLLGVPRVVNNHLMVRVFAGNAREFLQNAGCFLLKNYNTSDNSQGIAAVRAGGDEGLRHKLDLILRHSEDRPQFIPFVNSLKQDDVVTVVPLDPSVVRDHLIVIAPPDNVDLVCPIEAICTTTDGETRLLDLANKSIIYADGYHRPQGTLAARCVAPQILVADQQVPPHDLDLVKEVAKRLPNQQIIPFELSSPQPTFGGASSLILIGHDDSRGRLREWIGRLDVAGLQSVVLLVCGSARYEEVRGPFAAGMAFDIRRKLGEGGALAATRIPIDLKDGLPLILSILNDAGQLPLAEVVHQHVRRANPENPFRAPWIVF